MDEILAVKNLNMGFNTGIGFRKALFDVSFSVKKGQMHALVGESGCGKSMSAMSILNLLPKNAEIKSGCILFNHKNILSLKENEMREIRGSKIALIPQDPMTSLNPLYTIGNQLIEVIELHQNLKGNYAKEKAIEALKKVQIPSAEERFNQYPHEFSGGMKQRAIIAMALACNAEFIIADEPTTALDVTIQAQIMKLLSDIKKDFGTSILLITHDLALVSQYADEISVMYSGRIVENAPTKEFFENTNHPYSIALLKSLPENKNKKLSAIKGQPPSIMEDISGCRFHNRCKFCIPTQCVTKIPDLKFIAKNHSSACFLN
ncbi:ABC transporter ATP-binding protein [bacterium]|nr:ABC transporter ATP-binding protein [bacterium]